jgi:hypothetical protein
VYMRASDVEYAVNFDVAAGGKPVINYEIPPTPPPPSSSSTNTITFNGKTITFKDTDTIIDKLAEGKSLASYLTENMAGLDDFTVILSMLMPRDLKNSYDGKILKIMERANTDMGASDYPKNSRAIRLGDLKNLITWLKKQGKLNDTTIASLQNGQSRAENASLSTDTEKANKASIDAQIYQLIIAQLSEEENFSQNTACTVDDDLPF